MDTGGVRGLVQRFEEIKEVQASQSTRDTGLGGLKRSNLKMILRRILTLTQGSWCDTL